MSSAHIVVVDDDFKSLQVLAGTLDMLGVTSTTIQDPTLLQASLETLENVDAIFVDLEMPDLNGYELLNMLKNDLQVSVPVVAYSVHTSEINHARQLGFDGFIAKPLKLSQFSDRLNRILSGERVWDID
jgi:CheY-like chemotaxis protein